MPKIEVTLNEEDIHAACKWWAVNRVLSGGKPIHSGIKVEAYLFSPEKSKTRVVVEIEVEE